MSQLQTAQPLSDDSACLRWSHVDKTYQPQAEDILSDEHLLDVFRIVKQVLQKKRDPENLAKFFFCVSYALGDQVRFYRPLHGNRIVFDDCRFGTNAVRLPSTSTCCESHSCSNNDSAPDPSHKWPDTASLSSTSSSTVPASPLARLSYMSPSAALVTHSLNHHHHHGQQQLQTTTTTMPHQNKGDDTSTDSYTVRPYTNFRPLYPTPSDNTTGQFDAHRHNSLKLSSSSGGSGSASGSSPLSITRSPKQIHQHTEYLMEPKQRGFYYQDGRISREPVLLQRYAEHGVLTQASLMRKRKRPMGEQVSDIMAPPTVPNKKTKIPHRHGEFEQRRDDIISRLRSITMTDLEQKADQLPVNYSLAIESVPILKSVPHNLTTEQAADLLAPTLRILRSHTSMKPHLDNGMNQNGIYYNTDYFRLYLAFEQFQNTFQLLFPDQVIKLPEWSSEGYTDAGSSSISSPLSSSATQVDRDRDRDRDRNSNMKVYRSWIEPLLAETNWAAFRRNIVVGERMMQLCKVIGQGVLLMTKELSGSKLHLTFTNNEWEEFITGLCSGRWDQTIQWDHHHRSRSDILTKSVLVAELRTKLLTGFWFYEDGRAVPGEERRKILATENASST